MSNAEPETESTHHYHTLFGAPEGQDARVLIDRARALMPDDRVLCHVALDDSRVLLLQDMIAFFDPDVDVVVFPAWDCLPYDRVSPHSEIVAKRVAALVAMLAWAQEKARKPRIVLTTVNAVIQRVIPSDVLAQSVFIAQKGGMLDLAHMQNFLQQNGYMRTDTVREAGEYSIRGGIVDLFPPGYDQPFRVDLFGDEIESIRLFDPVSQRTEKRIPKFALYPATEFFLDDESIARFRRNYRDLFGVVRDADPLYEAVSDGRRYNGMDHWQPLFLDHMETVFDYMRGADIVLDYHAEQARQERLNHVQDFYAARKSLQDAAISRKKGNKENRAKEAVSGAVYNPIPVDRLYIQDEEWHGLADDAVLLSPFKKPDAATSDDVDFGAQKGRDFSDVRAMPDGDVFAALSEYIAASRMDGRKILVAAYSEGARTRLKGLMENAGFANLRDVDGKDDLKALHAREVGFAILTMEHGFIADDLLVLTEQDILGDRLVRRRQKRKKADNFLTEVSSLAPGDLVVHMEHGIGRFDGLETLEVMKVFHDCLKITYAGDDRLFVPVENIDVLSRFGTDEGSVQLDKLGGGGWQARKARVKKDLMRMADQLLKIAAQRQLQKGEALRLEPAMYDKFVSKFPYQETEDQLRSIDNVLEDLSSTKPMDRLICGDVGFGKTEIALRAAYVAAMNGVQVAMIVPTTLLARQHYNNFVERFQGTGLRVEQLSRLVKDKDAKHVREALAEGTVNIVIGTHALLAKTIKFAHLGLLIVDEEQRFGVKQKEALKDLKHDIHVLTLTATPIPRTLQLSLTGVRDLSIIATPPVDRLATRTFVLPYDPMVVREAILREHYRGGQTFYVCPRIKDMKELEEHLRTLVPEISIITAHGQMAPTDLEDRMTAFCDGQYDVLLTTNIIESGIDIPTANTMIVHRADMFGLAQLYQIRGRIGRSKVRAYAYMTYEPTKMLSDQAHKRLEVLETLDTLGSGFQLASHDMDIRGAGNLLGEEQSGHIKEVGVELYQQMLEEAVAAARQGLDWEKGETAAEEHWSPQINLGTSVLIPEHYVEDLNVRMSLYRRLSDLETKEDIESFAAEMIDRFGPIPDEVENLMQIVDIKQLCRKAGVSHVEAGPKGAVIGFYKNNPPNVNGLMAWMQSKLGSVKLRPDHKLVAVREWDTTGKRVKGVRSILNDLTAL